MRSTAYLAVVAALCSLSLGCNEGQQSQQSASNRGSSTSGGESEGGESEGGSRDLESPPGSVEPDENMPDSDIESEASTPSTPATPTTPGSPQQAGNQESPWGQPDAETGRPLPPRRPMNASAQDAYRRGLAASASGDDRSARQAFQQALDADSSAYKAAYNLGVLADRAGDEARALQYYQQSLRIQPDYERAIEGIATIHIRRGNAGEAVNFVRPLAEQWVRNLHVQAVYGDVLVQANRPEEAVEAARRALRRDERFVPAMIVLVKANLRLERTELATTILDQAIETNANVAELHYLRGRLHQGEGNLAPALTSYRRAIELEPGFTEARMALGLQQMAGGNYADALEQFQTASQLAPGLVSVRLALGDALRATKAWPLAKAEFDRVQQMEPQNAQVHFNLALMYMAAQDQFPGTSTLEALQRAVSELNRYRELMGPRLRRDDASNGYLEELGRLITREQQRIERDRARAEREAARAARQAAEQQQAPQPEQPAQQPAQ